MKFLKQRTARLFSPILWSDTDRTNGTRDWTFLVELEDGPDAGRQVMVKVDVRTLALFRENLISVTEPEPQPRFHHLDNSVCDEPGPGTPMICLGHDRRVSKRP